MAKPPTYINIHIKDNPPSGVFLYFCIVCILGILHVGMLCVFRVWYVFVAFVFGVFRGWYLVVCLYFVVVLFMCIVWMLVYLGVGSFYVIYCCMSGLVCFLFRICCMSVDCLYVCVSRGWYFSLVVVICCIWSWWAKWTRRPGIIIDHVMWCIHTVQYSRHIVYIDI